MYNYEVELTDGSTTVLYEDNILCALRVLRKFRVGTFYRVRRQNADGSYDGWWLV